jgi:ABC-2 type transport system permease protein
MFSRIYAVMEKEFRQLSRDRRTLPIIILAPLIQLILLGYAANLDIRHITLAVSDCSRSSESRELIRRFSESGYFDLVSEVDDIRKLDPLIDRGEARAGLVIPANFSTRMGKGSQASLALILDGSDANTARIALGYASMIVERFSREKMMASLDNQFAPDSRGLTRAMKKGEADILDPRIRIFYNPELKSRNFFVPGVIALILMVITTILTAGSIAREKESGTLEQLIVSPIRKREIIIGKLAPYVVIGFIDIGLVLVAGIFWFRVPFRGNVFLLLIASALFLMSTLGLGLLFSIISRNQQQAMISAFFSIIPSMMLSGFVFPIENMPRLAQYITYLIPIRYFLVIVRSIFLKGVGFSALANQFIALFILGTSFFLTSLLLFRKRV